MPLKLGVVGVGLAAVPRRQQPRPGGQSGWHVEHVFSVSDQLLSNAQSQAGGPFDSPPPLRPAGGEGDQLAQRGWFTGRRVVDRIVPSWLSPTAVSEDLWGSIPIVIMLGSSVSPTTGHGAFLWLTTQPSPRASW